MTPKVLCVGTVVTKTHTTFTVKDEIRDNYHVLIVGEATLAEVKVSAEQYENLAQGQAVEMIAEVTSYRDRIALKSPGVF